MEEYKPSRWKSPLLWGAVATLAVLGFGVWSFFMPACSIGFDQQVICTSKWFYLSRATPNEVGDTLAGFAGTFAFIWIIATVAMQSQELAAQREELSLTRREFERMADAQDRQAALLVAQGKIFEREQAEREQSFVDKEIEALLVGIASQFSRHIERRFRWISLDPPEVSPWDGEKGVSLHCFGSENAQLDDRIFNQVKGAIKSIEEIEAGLDAGEFIRLPDRTEEITQLSEMCDKVAARLATSSPAMQERVRATRLERLVVPLANFVRRKDAWSEGGNQ
jgi:hypothetical protein